MTPETRYAVNGDVHLAYQVFGKGPPDLLVIESWVHHVELVWDITDQAQFLRRLGGFARVVIFDRRGTGLSDPIPLDRLPDLETQVGDALAVLDAADSARPALLGVGDGGLVAMLLTAVHPERCDALVLQGSAAKYTHAPDYPWGMPEAAVEDTVQSLTKAWAQGGTEHVAWLAPSRADDQRFLQQAGRLSRAAVRPGAVAHYFRQAMNTDVREILPTIQAPTLILQRTGDRVCPVENARYLAEHIPGARLVEFPGEDHLPFTEAPDTLLGEIEEFLTGARTLPDLDRILATVLFTDIVGSTERAAALGDQRWRDVLEEHHRVVRAELERYRGREVKTTGDGVLATFDGPARAIRCTQSMRSALRKLGIEIRAGIHTGECELIGLDVGGIAVHIAARVAAMAEPGEVLVSSTVKDLVAGSAIEFDDRGRRTLKGVPGEWHLFAAREA